MPALALVEATRAAFADDGLLARADPHYARRDGQIEMACAVARVVEQGGALVVEAGTGIGKTYAYLLPALHSGERVLISTATKTLQDQLFGRDLPHLLALLGLPLRVALLKGRNNYLCLHRLGQARQHETLAERRHQRTLARIELWASATASGDLAELPDLDERSPVIPLVTSTRDNCLGQACPQWRACHVNLARREALAADVVVVNHHLFFADLAVRESGVAELLPTVRVAIFDEAHQLNETGVQFLGAMLGTAQLIDLARDILAAGLQQARGLADWTGVASALEQPARALRLCAGRAPASGRLRWVEPTPEGLDAEAWRQALQDVGAGCAQADAALATVSEIGPDFERLRERAQRLAERAAAFAAPAPADAVRWLELGAQLRLVESPLDIAATVRSRLIGGEAQAGRSWVFTSATLGDDERLSWFTQPCGLDDAQRLRVGSPFDYARQAALYVPRDLPRPGEPGHSEALAARSAQWARQLGGRTLVLTTTLRALRSIGDALQQSLGEGDGIEVLVQGSAPKRVLIERFRAAGPAGAVLVASASFWEGVDIPGAALQLVVIDKLPFPPPGDPLVEARGKRLQAEGRSPFDDYFLPEAAVALKQGAGRLIRRESDRGVLVLADTRLLSMGYGRRLLRALPPLRRLADEAEMRAELERLRALTRASTTDPTPA